jgi:hypothetical protein
VAWNLGLLGAASFVAPTGSYDLLQTEILTSSQASVTFSSLGDYAADYQHLQIRAVASGTGVLALRFNGVTTSGAYKDHRLVGFNGSVTSDTINTDRIYIGRGTDQAPMVIDILDPFVTTKNKTVRTLNGDLASIPVIQLISGAWFNTASVTSITLLTQGSWTSLSRFSLYGLRK